MLPIEVQGRIAWTKKHSYFGCDPCWHDLWELLIPSEDCLCWSYYAKLKEENPPNFSSPEKYFEWGVWLHNKINEKLLKPQMTLEDANKLWNRNNAKA